MYVSEEKLITLIKTDYTHKIFLHIFPEAKYATMLSLLPGILLPSLFYA